MQKRKVRFREIPGAMPHHTPTIEASIQHNLLPSSRQYPNKPQDFIRIRKPLSGPAKKPFFLIPNFITGFFGRVSRIFRR